MKTKRREQAPALRYEIVFSAKDASPRHVFFVFFSFFRIAFVSSLTDPKGKDQRRHTRDQLGNDHGGHVGGIHCHGKCEVRTKHKGGGNTERRVENHATGIHVLCNAPGGGVADQRWEKSHGGSAVDTKGFSKERSRLVQQLAQHEHQGECTRKRDAGADADQCALFQGRHVRNGGFAHKEGINAQPKSYKAQKLNALADSAQDLNGKLGGKGESHGQKNRQKDEGKESDNDLPKCQATPKAHGNASHGNGGNAAEEAKEQILMLRGVNHTGRHGNGVGNGASHHGGHDKGIVEPNGGGFSKGERKGRSAHIVCKDGGGDHRGINAKKTVEALKHGQKHYAESGRKDQNTQGGESLHAKHGKASGKFRAKPEFVSNDPIQKSQKGEDQDDNGKKIHYCFFLQPSI